MKGHADKQQFGLVFIVIDKESAGSLYLDHHLTHRGLMTLYGIVVLV